MFVDTSAIVAIIVQEAGSPEIERALDQADLKISSPLVLLEATMVLSSKVAISPFEAEKRVRRLFDEAGIAVSEITDTTASIAIEAFQRYGKGRGSGAGLNMSDCLSYACAKQHRMPLLYVGDDFAKTDLA